MDNKHLFTAALGLVAPWSVVSIDFVEDQGSASGRLDIHIDFARGAELPCPECGTLCKAHDTKLQSWRHLDFFQHEAHLHARVPRVRCSVDGVKKVDVPWARPGSGFTLLFEALVLTLAPQMSMSALARLVREHDTRLWRVVDHYVLEARENVDMSDVTEIVVDETSRAKRHQYVSLFLEPESSASAETPRVIFVTEGKDHSVFHDFVADLKLHDGHVGSITDVCMDMSAAFRKGAAETMPLARVTYDRFHVMKLVNEAVDDARRRETKLEPQLKGTRYAWLKNPSKLTKKQCESVARLSQRNLKTAKAYHMRLNLQDLWAQPHLTATRTFLKRWCQWALKATARPKDPADVWILERMNTAANTLKDNATDVVNYFRRLLTSGVIEGVNSTIQAARSRARGYRNPRTFKMMIYLIAGKLDLGIKPIHSR